MSDFGISSLIEKVSGKEKIDCGYWTAPEILENKQPFGIESDAYSFGAIMYELLTDGKTIERKEEPPKIEGQTPDGSTPPPEPGSSSATLESSSAVVVSVDSGKLAEVQQEMRSQSLFSAEEGQISDFVRSYVDLMRLCLSGDKSKRPSFKTLSQFFSPK